ncbi:MAG: sigma-70 family RNA polymerase sigma factor [Desulfobulbaceae bacterium]|jgi:RNA polymerase sigma-70 factor (ECF subfamily)|nr:sigma-70 family RNA polymerase sigma factor [Desulfobulbaceae bacterium]
MELFVLLLTLVFIVTTSFPSMATEKCTGPDETTELVRAVLGGDKQSFNRLVILYQARIYNLAYNYVKTEEEAKDVAQDVFVTAYRALPKLRDDTKFGAWLYQIGINHCRNRYKKLKRRGYFTNKSIDNEDDPVHLEGGDSPEQKLEQQRTIKLVRNAIAQMSESEKEVLMLRDLQGLPYDEISEILDVPLGTVKSKLNRARLNLKNKLKQIYPNL